MRRAGWRVRFLPRVTGSFEETPGTLDRLCAARSTPLVPGQPAAPAAARPLRGLHPVSRFHLFHGAVRLSAVPCVVLSCWSCWASAGAQTRNTNVIRVFPARPTRCFPDWPPAMSHIDSAVFPGDHVCDAADAQDRRCAGIIAANGKAANRVFGGRPVLPWARFWSRSCIVDCRMRRS